MATERVLPEVSIVVDTGNIGTETRELTGVCSALLSEIAMVHRACEVVIVTAHDSYAVLAAAKEAGLVHGPSVRVFAEPTSPGYYQMKNRAASHAAGEIVAFIDCDVRPEPGWLAALLVPFEDSRIQFVGGSTYVGPLRDTFTRALAMSGNFPLRTHDEIAHPHDRFWANNFAGRRAFLLDHPFSEDGRLRGQCWSLARDLSRQGLTVWAAPNARVVHPPPPRDRLWRFAFGAGRDMVETERIGRERVLLRWFVLSGFFVRRTIRPLGSARRQVGLSVRSVPAALVWAATFNAAAWLGSLAELLRPAKRSALQRGAGAFCC